MILHGGTVTERASSTSTEPSAPWSAPMMGPARATTSRQASPAAPPSTAPLDMNNDMHKQLVQKHYVTLRFNQLGFALMRQGLQAGTIRGIDQWPCAAGPEVGPAGSRATSRPFRAFTDPPRGGAGCWRSIPG